MASGKPRKKRQRLLESLEALGVRRVGVAEFAALARELAPVSEDYLRELLRATGIPLDAMVEGVRQDSLDELDRTLLGLLAEYEAGDAARRRQVRGLVIVAKDHARLAAGRLEGGKRAGREEMILRMLTWLENPGVFRDWLQLRNARLSEER